MLPESHIKAVKELAEEIVKTISDIKTFGSYSSLVSVEDVNGKAKRIIKIIEEGDIIDIELLGKQWNEDKIENQNLENHLDHLMEEDRYRDYSYWDSQDENINE